ncbi:hypothetical protein [Paenibacillus vini]|uniref:Uncharacterized protein n=1 Tax=Paenibacillus vini TaxID=1476024 RepID=A0ABQ4M653_9BACL|nr:hypothetical protein [Paenibacillus vini]GIP51478.1 hypothetical protein J42TS3_05130 [Paenibacillus vini]
MTCTTIKRCGDDPQPIAGAGRGILPGRAGGPKQFRPEVDTGLQRAAKWVYDMEDREDRKCLPMGFATRSMSISDSRWSKDAACRLKLYEPSKR